MAGAVNVREAEVDPVELATPTVGESGAVAGVTETGDEGLVEIHQPLAAAVGDAGVFLGLLGVEASLEIDRARNSDACSAQAFAAQLMHAFIAPFARGHGLARLLVQGVEDRAREMGSQILNLDVREFLRARTPQPRELVALWWDTTA